EVTERRALAAGRSWHWPCPREEARAVTAPRWHAPLPRGLAWPVPGPARQLQALVRLPNRFGRGHFARPDAFRSGALSSGLCLSGTLVSDFSGFLRLFGHAPSFLQPATTRYSAWT